MRCFTKLKKVEVLSVGWLVGGGGVGAMRCDAYVNVCIYCQLNHNGGEGGSRWVSYMLDMSMSMIGWKGVYSSILVSPNFLRFTPTSTDPRLLFTSKLSAASKAMTFSFYN